MINRLLLILISFLTLVFADSTNAQTECSSKEYKSLKKEYRREKDLFKKGEIALQLFDCGQLRNDTSYREWLLQTIDIYKKRHKVCKADKSDIIYQTALCYHKLENYRMSETWFRKAVKINYPNPLTSYYYGQSLFYQEKYSEAFPILEGFKIQSDDNQNVDELISECREKLKSKGF